MKNNNNLTISKLFNEINLLKEQFEKINRGEKIDFNEKYLTLPILAITQNKKGRVIRNLTFTLSNDKFLDHNNAIKAIYNTLIINPEFKKFGKNKVIITMANVNGAYYGFHHNVLINNKTTFDEFYSEIKNNLEVNYEAGYPTEIIPIFEIKVWNMDKFVNKDIKITKNATTKTPKFTINQKRSYSTNNRNFIKPIAKKQMAVIGDEFATTDLETMSVNGSQMPVLITFNSNKKVKHFLINHALMKVNPELAVTKLFRAYFYYVKNCGIETVFVHNLGGFDGYFIYKYLLTYSKNNPENVSAIIDSHNRFISITLRIDSKKIVWKDSYRVFPISLNQLCKVFNVSGKVSTYNPLFNNLDLFNNSELLKTFISYGVQDSVSLYNALLKAQEIYLEKYCIDICTILSTSSLSLKIFRLSFLKSDITILKSSEDRFIRNGYFGGATDYYKGYAKDVYYYDVNSLYPHAMLKPMPDKISKFIRDMKDYNLNDFFGFCLAEIETPNNLLRPLLPYRSDDMKTIFPTGTWTGTYFSEELKEIVKLGYKVKLISGYEFTKIDLFSGYVNHFYEEKKRAQGAERFIAKMHLNQLYGVFGRKQELLETINVRTDDVPNYLITRVVKTIIEVNDEISTLLIYNNIPNTILGKINLTLTNKDVTLKSFDKLVKTNVAIAAAVTAYARIEMIPYKLDDGICYTDTDSIFTTNKLPNHLIGKDLGLMKDELNGQIIKEAYFLGIKKYGYYYIDSETKQTITSSVFAGVERDGLNFNEVKAIYKGETITKSIPTRFYKSLTNLNIKIDSAKVSVTRSLDKNLVKNQYMPKNVSNNKSNQDVILIAKLIKRHNK